MSFDAFLKVKDVDSLKAVLLRLDLASFADVFFSFWSVYCHTCLV